MDKVNFPRKNNSLPENFKKIVKTMENETKQFNLVGFIMAYENGELQEDEVIEGFQH